LQPSSAFSKVKAHQPSLLPQPRQYRLSSLASPSHLTNRPECVSCGTQTDTSLNQLSKEPEEPELKAGDIDRNTGNSTTASIENSGLSVETLTDAAEVNLLKNTLSIVQSLQEDFQQIFKRKPTQEVFLPECPSSVTLLPVVIEESNANPSAGGDPTSLQGLSSTICMVSFNFLSS
jgi:hypothetical protein